MTDPFIPAGAPGPPRRPAQRILGLGNPRARLLAAGLVAVAVLVLASPLLMLVLPASALPWARLANIGDAYGGVSALLSALALCGVGASLIFQRRQVRQELADFDRQQHMELLKLAIDNPELIQVLDAGAADREDARAEIYANLMMMYWLTIWELGEIGEQELRGMASAMFGSRLTREWWRRVGDNWVGTRNRPGRVRFLEIVSDECAAARPGAEPPVSAPPWTFVFAGAAVVACGVVLARRRQGRRIRPDRTSSMKQRQASAS
jgi:hypothetical protein